MNGDCTSPDTNLANRIISIWFGSLSLIQWNLRASRSPVLILIWSNAFWRSRQRSIGLNLVLVSTLHSNYLFTYLVTLSITVSASCSCITWPYISNSFWPFYKFLNGFLNLSKLPDLLLANVLQLSFRIKPVSYQPFLSFLNYSLNPWCTVPSSFRLYVTPRTSNL